MRCFEVASFLTWVINYKVAMRMFSRVKNLTHFSPMTSKGNQAVVFILFFKYLNESNRTASLITNFALFNHDVQRLGHPAPPCPKNREETCLQLLERNYNQIGLEIKQKTRKLDWKSVEIVEKLAKELKLQCDVLK